MVEEKGDENKEMSDLWLTGTLTRLFSFRFEYASGTILTLSTSGRVVIMGNACSILGEGILIIYLLRPLSIIIANIMPRKTYLRDIIHNLDE